MARTQLAITQRFWLLPLLLLITVIFDQSHSASSSARLRQKLGHPTYTSTTTDPPACRDRTLWPFSNTSIWNTPIGSGAVFEPANIYHNMDPARACQLRENAPSRRTVCPGIPANVTRDECEAKGCCYSETPKPDPGHLPWCFLPAGIPPRSFHNDKDYMIVTSASDPNTTWYSQGDWGPDDHCQQRGRQAAIIPFPYNFTTATAGNPPGLIGNNAAAVLLPDRRTLLQMQPLYRCQPGGPILAQYHHGCPQPFPWEMDILSDGNLGAHGGSGLSAIGGTIRLGELLPDSGPIRHALKIQLFAHDYYFGDPNNTCYPDPTCTYRWPAVGSDAYTFSDGSDMRYNGTLPYLSPGALLAIPEQVAANISLKTIPGKKIADALRDYGAYIVDDTASDTAAIGMEAGVDDEFKRVYNQTIDLAHPVMPGTAFYDDLVVLFQSLWVVVNNTPGSVGGGGTPRQPYAPPICP